LTNIIKERDAETRLQMTLEQRGGAERAAGETATEGLPRRELEGAGEDETEIVHLIGVSGSSS
jgi:hypothetical protein